MEIQNQGFDHVEFVVHDNREMSRVFQRMGFEKIGERKLPKTGTHTVVYAQGLVKILLTQPLSPTSSTGSGQLAPSEALTFLKEQGEGVCLLALKVQDATRAYQDAVNRGARSAREPAVFKRPGSIGNERVVRSEIFTLGRVRYAFMERHSSWGNGYHEPHQDKTGQSGILFDEDLVVTRMESPSPLGIIQIDHLTNNVGIGEMKDWVAYYKDIFGFKVSRHFDIRTGRTGLISDVIESSDRKVIVPINEPTEQASQIQEFVDRMKGSGVQHLALLCEELPATLKKLRRADFKFLKVPHTYYETVPTRVPGVVEDLGEMEELGILLDGESTGYLLQIFSEEILGPFFFEYIQRKGNQGFGEGNFKALFEAIERDQIRRGVLKA